MILRMLPRLVLRKADIIRTMFTCRMLPRWAMRRWRDTRGRCLCTTPMSLIPTPTTALAPRMLLVLTNRLLRAKVALRLHHSL